MQIYKVKYNFWAWSKYFWKSRWKSSLKATFNICFILLAERPKTTDTIPAHQRCKKLWPQKPHWVGRSSSWPLWTCQPRFKLLPRIFAKIDIGQNPKHLAQKMVCFQSWIEKTVIFQLKKIVKWLQRQQEH